MTDYRQPPQPPQPQPRPAAPQPQPAAPQPEGPRGSHVHHSYIWLGSLRTAFMLLAIVVFSSFSASSAPSGAAALGVGTAAGRAAAGFGGMFVA